MKKEQKFIGDIPISVESVHTDSSNGKNIIFIHMSWGGAWAFSKYMKFFSKHGYNCYALDLRGHGNSGGAVEGATMQDYVDDVQTMVEGLGLDLSIVIGHSMGGLIALMYSAQYGSSATVAIDASPSLEVQKTSEEKQYAPAYTPQDSGMPSSPLKAMELLPDMYPWHLMKLRMNLKLESGIARSDRKRGISIPKDKLVMPLFFVGAELGATLPFGIGIEKAKAQADYYDAPFVEIKGATHPGILFGKYWKKSAEAILDFLN